MKERYSFRVEMKVEKDTADVMIYSGISSDKFWGDEYTPEDFDKELKAAQKKGAKKLNLRINSPGGDVFSAVAMRSMIINAEFESVRVMIEGLCASAATLFATVPGAHVVIADGSEFMIHNPMTITWGNADEIQKTVDHLRSMEGTFHEMYAGKCGKSTEQIKEWMDETTWFTARRAVEEGFCDELLETEKAVASVSAADMLLMQAMYARVPEEIKVSAEGTKAAGNASAGGFSAGALNASGDPLPGSNPALISPEGDAPDANEAAGAVTEPISGAGTGTGENLAGTAEEPVSGTAAGAATNGSNENPVAGFSTVNKNKEEPNTMEIKDCTREQLLAENPALVDEIVNQAVAEERARVSEIDDLTMPGYEADAAEAKANGMSAVEFVKTIAAKAKQKGAAFMAQRAVETAPAANVTAGAAEEDHVSEEEQIRNLATELAGYAEEMSGKNTGMF